MNAKDWTKAHLNELLKSNTVRALVALEAGSIGVFINGVMTGTQKIDVESLKGWALLQAGITIAFFIRHAIAGIELKLNGLIEPAVVEEIENDFIGRIAGKNPALGKAIQDHLSDKT